VDPQKPPLTCAQCFKVIEPGDALTLAVREGAEPGDVSTEDLATLHQSCWEPFRRAHNLPARVGPRPDEPDF
jgi:hypothetical protein